MFFRVPGKEITIIFYSDFEITVSQMQKIGTAFLEGKAVNKDTKDGSESST